MKLFRLVQASSGYLRLVRNYFQTRKVDVSVTGALLLAGSILYGYLLTYQYIAWEDFVLPTSWMKITAITIQSQIAGYTSSSSLFTPNLIYSNNLFIYLLSLLLGNFSYHVFTFTTQILWGPIIYLFSRYFRVTRVTSLLLSVFSMFNPFVASANADSLMNLYFYEFTFPLIIFYLEFRVKRKFYLLPLLVLIINLPPVFNSVPLLMIGSVILLEASFLICKPRARTLPRELLTSGASLFVLLGSFIVAHYGSLVYEKSILGTLGVHTPPGTSLTFNFLEMITFNGSAGYENTLLIFFDVLVYQLVTIAALGLFVILVTVLLLKFKQFKTLDDFDIRLLLTFAALFIVFGSAVYSYSSDYLAVNYLISKVFPYVYNIDSGSMVIFPLVSLILLSIIVDRVLFTRSSGCMGESNLVHSQLAKAENNIMAAKETGNKTKHAISLRGINRRLRARSFPKSIFVVWALIALIASPFVVFSIHLSEAQSRTSIPASDVLVYNWITENANGFVLTIPSTYAINFNYSTYSVTGLGKTHSITDADFWWNFPPALMIKSGPYYSQLLNELYSNSTVSGISFNNLASILGIEYLINFEPNSVVSYWGSGPPLTNEYISQHTDFAVALETNGITVFRNPNFRGLAYTTNQVIVSDNVTNAVLTESANNLSLPVVNSTDYSVLSSLTQLHPYFFAGSIGNNRQIVQNIPTLRLTQSMFLHEYNTSIIQKNNLEWVQNSLQKIDSSFTLVNSSGNSSLYQDSNLPQSSDLVYIRNTTEIVGQQNMSANRIINLNVSFPNSLISFNARVDNNSNVVFVSGQLQIGVSGFWNDITLGGNAGFINYYLPQGVIQHGVQIQVATLNQTTIVTLDGELIYAVAGIQPSARAAYLIAGTDNSTKMVGVTLSDLFNSTLDLEPHHQLPILAVSSLFGLIEPIMHSRSLPRSSIISGTSNTLDPYNSSYQNVPLHIGQNGKIMISINRTDSQLPVYTCFPAFRAVNQNSMVVLTINGYFGGYVLNSQGSSNVSLILVDDPAILIYNYLYVSVLISSSTFGLICYIFGIRNRHKLPPSSLSGMQLSK